MSRDVCWTGQWGSYQQVSCAVINLSGITDSSYHFLSMALHSIHLTVLWRGSLSRAHTTGLGLAHQGLHNMAYTRAHTPELINQGTHTMAHTQGLTHQGSNSRAQTTGLRQGTHNRAHAPRLILQGSYTKVPTPHQGSYTRAQTTWLRPGHTH